MVIKLQRLAHYDPIMVKENVHFSRMASMFYEIKAIGQASEIGVNNLTYPPLNHIRNISVAIFLSTLTNNLAQQLQLRTLTKLHTITIKRKPSLSPVACNKILTNTMTDGVMGQKRGVQTIQTRRMIKS